MHSDKDIPTIHSSWNWNTAQECLSKIVSIQTDKSTVEKNVTNFIFFSFEKQNIWKISNTHWITEWIQFLV